MEKGLLYDEDTAVSGSGSGSGITDLSNLENETDEFGRRILEHERETRRAKIAARQPFWRSRTGAVRPRSWVNDQEEAIEIGRPGHRRTASAGNAGAEPEPPLNVPKEWGKRSRRRPSWLKRNESEVEVQPIEADQTEEPARVDEDSIIPRRTVYTGDGWEAGIDSPRNSIETTPPSMRRLQRHASSPSSMHHMNTTLPTIDTDDDFSAASLLASTPNVNQRNRKIDEIMKREIETVEKRGVTKKTLHQITERYSNEQLRPNTAPAAETSRIPRPRSSANSREVPSAEEVASKDDLIPQVSNPKKQKPSHTRNDSMSLLRRLARVSSLSPTPAKERNEIDPPAANKVHELTNGDIGAVNDRVNGISQEGKKYRVEFDLPRSELDGEATLDDHISKRLQEPETKITINRNSQTKPNPKSALEEVVNEAKTSRDNYFGDSTIASLEDIMKPRRASSDSSTAANLEQAARTRQLRITEIDKTNSNSRRQQIEDGALKVMIDGLNTTQATIEDANQGLKSIEEKLGNVEVVRVSTDLPADTTPYTDHNGRTVCDCCGGRYTSVWRGLWVEFRENFYTWDPRANFGLRPTWLGIACVAWWSWLFLETTLCSYHCQPRYARSMEGFGVDPDAPEFPFVFLTLLFRPFRLVWSSGGVFLAWLVGSVVQSLFGGGGGSSSSNSPSKDSAASLREKGPFGVRKMMPESTRLVGNWMATAGVATSSTTRRVTESTIEAVDRFARMWEDGIGPS